jgi:hypothetical protein
VSEPYALNVKGFIMRQANSKCQVEAGAAGVV